jgi:type II secretory pathway pseudopilin PulG
MNRGADSSKSKQGGYTIVETLIFLAVSGLMLTMAMVFVSGKQARQQFQTTVRDFETSLTDIANDVSNGNYTNNDDPFVCKVNAIGIPYFPADQSTGATTAGTHSECIFVGTVVKFGSGGSTSGREQVIQYVMMGARQRSGKDVVSLTEANPRIISQASTKQITNIGAGATVECIKVGASSCDDNNAAIGFFTTFQGSDLASHSGGALQTEVLSYKTLINIDDNDGEVRRKLNPTPPATVDYSSASTSVERNPDITICISGGSNQHALVHIGSNGSSRLTVTSEILGGNSCS